MSVLQQREGNRKTRQGGGGGQAGGGQQEQRPGRARLGGRSCEPCVQPTSGSLAPSSALLPEVSLLSFLKSSLFFTSLLWFIDVKPQRMMGHCVFCALNACRGRCSLWVQVTACGVTCREILEACPEVCHLPSWQEREKGGRIDHLLGSF